MIKALVRKCFASRETLNHDVDDAAMMSNHATVIKEKLVLRSAFEEFYLAIKNVQDSMFLMPSVTVEVGSGAGFAGSYFPGLITSDLRTNPLVDVRFDATAIPLCDSSCTLLFGINVFHHIPNPTLFLREVSRVLQPGGACVLIEPDVGLFSRIIHSVIHEDEFFDMEQPDWINSNISGPMSGANQALASIVFDRDRARFEREFGCDLKLVSTTRSRNSLRYLLSGGLGFRALVPAASLPLVVRLDTLLGKTRLLALHRMIVLSRV